MWIVRLALRRPYTFVVLALLIAVLGVLSVTTMSVDIFPSINIPVVTVIWQFNGLSPTEMEGRIITVSERAFTTTVDGIEHIESVSLRGVSVTRLYFQPNVPIGGDHAGERLGAGNHQDSATWHLSAANPPIQRGQRSGAPSKSQQRSAE